MISRTVTAIRRNIVAWLALFVSLGGTGMAASHYIITSTRQIKPSVIKQLRGATGARGATGPQGPAGSSGPVGPAGLKGETSRNGEKGEKGLAGKEGPTGEEGPPGEKGLTGERGTALAYAHVSSTGEIEAANSKLEGATVELAEAGVYCISGLDFKPHNVVATVDAEAEVPGFVTATVGATKYTSKCKTRPEITVETWGAVAKENVRKEIEDSTVDLAFYVAIN